MRTLQSLLRGGRIFIFVLADCLLSSGVLFAKEGSTGDSSSGGGSWVFSYFLTGLAVVLGMLVICRSSTRRDRVKPEAYVEGKVSQGKEEK